MISNKLKKIIFDKLYDDLKQVEIIPYKDSIWFIDRENKYFYFEYQKDGVLWWRERFFTKFFHLFSMEHEEYKWIIAEWVEEVLNCKVKTTNNCFGFPNLLVEEVLNCKVKVSHRISIDMGKKVEEVLNCKVKKTYGLPIINEDSVRKVLNYISK